MFHDLFERLAVTWEACETSTCCDRGHVRRFLIAAIIRSDHVIRLGYISDHTRCDTARRPILITFLHRQEYQELVASGPDQQVTRPDAPAQSLGDDLEQTITGIVTKPVIHAFEIVKIDGENAGAKIRH